MKKGIHHCVLYDYKGQTYIYESIIPRRLFVGDFFLMFVRDIYLGDPVQSPLTNLEMTIDGEKVFTLSLLNLRKQSTGSAGRGR